MPLPVFEFLSSPRRIPVGSLGALLLAMVLTGPASAQDPMATHGMGPQGQLGPKDGRDLPPMELDRVGVGMAAPDFTLRTLAGDVVSLSDFRGRKNVVLVFYRGHW